MEISFKPRTLENRLREVMTDDLGSGRWTVAGDGTVTADRAIVLIYSQMRGTVEHREALLFESTTDALVHLRSPGGSGTGSFPWWPVQAVDLVTGRRWAVETTPVLANTGTRFEFLASDAVAA